MLSEGAKASLCKNWRCFTKQVRSYVLHCNACSRNSVMMLLLDFCCSILESKKQKNKTKHSNHFDFRINLDRYLGL